MSKTELLKGHSETIVLAALKDSAKHGYAISQYLQAETKQAFKFTPGMLYPMLHAMEKKKLIHAEWIASSSGPKRKVYSITSKGKRVLAVKTLEWQQFASLINQVIH